MDPERRFPVFNFPRREERAPLPDSGRIMIGVDPSLGGYCAAAFGRSINRTSCTTRKSHGCRGSTAIFLALGDLRKVDWRSQPAFLWAKRVRAFAGF